MVNAEKSSQLANYADDNYNEIYYGSEAKIAISIEMANGKTMDQYDFVVTFYVVPSHTIVVPKTEMQKSGDSYIALIDTNLLHACGRLKIDVNADVPDSDFFEGTRHYIHKSESNIQILKNDLL